MLTDSGPKWTRRKDACSCEIIEAVLDQLVPNGFASTKRTEVAQRVGVVKGTLYRYFDAKEDLFRASVPHLAGENLVFVEGAIPAVTVAALVQAMLRQIANSIG